MRGYTSVEFPAFAPNGKIVFSASHSFHGNRPLHTSTIRPDGTGLHKLFNREQFAVSPHRR